MEKISVGIIGTGNIGTDLLMKVMRSDVIECGIFAGGIDGLDAIALGPDLWDIHTTGETLSISSTERTYNLICRVLEKIK